MPSSTMQCTRCKTPLIRCSSLDLSLENGLDWVVSQVSSDITSQTNYLTRLLFNRNHGGRWDSYRSSPTMADPPKVGNRRSFPFRLTLHSPIWWELFTGNCMILTIGLWNRTIPLSRALINLLIVWTGNFLGCLTCAVLFSYETELFSQEPYLSFVRDLAYTKAKEHSWVNIFLRAIPANTLVCMAVMLGFAARDSAGKIMALWFPVVMFVIPGFEHAVANMFFISNGLLYGSPITIGW